MIKINKIIISNIYFYLTEPQPFTISYNKPMAWYKDKIFWGILAAAATVKAAAFAWLVWGNPLVEQALVFPDSLGYAYPAQTLLTYGSLWEAVSSAPMLLRTPGYPVFLALVQLISGNMTWAVAAAQNILSLCLLLPVYLSARRLGGVGTARWAAGFCAVSVLYFTLSFAVLTETLCVFLLAWFVYLVLRWLTHPRKCDLVGATLLLAAAVYVRPAVYYFIPVGFLLLMLHAWQQRSRALFFQGVCCFLLPLVTMIGAWQLRNYLQTGYGGFTSVGAYNLYMWNEDFVAKRNNISVAQAHQLLEQTLSPGFYNFPAKEQVKIYKQLAKPLLKQSATYKLARLPLWAGKTLLGTNQAHVTRLLLGRENTPDTALNQTGALPCPWLQTGWEKLLFMLAFMQVAAVVLLGTCGLWISRKKEPAQAVFLTVYTGYFWLLGSSFLGAYARFRAPFEFMLCITAAVAVQSFSRKRGRPPLP